jgi:hypothetical protein
MKTILLIAFVGVFTNLMQAQAPTIVTTASNCTIFRNFNLSDEGFSSPSIYGGGDDVSFFWNSAVGAEIETSGLSVRTGSLISPSYFQTVNGVLTVGFAYSAPAGTEYRIRVIAGPSSPPLEIIANTANGPVYTPLPGTSGNVCLLLSDADLTIGRDIRIEFTFRAFLPGAIVFDDLAATVAGGPLPVIFEGLVARRNADGTIKLLWDVGTEQNVQGYVVESSVDGTTFTYDGYVGAAGRDIYSFDHAGKLFQTMYFRVKSVDFDGRMKYTPIIKVYVNDEEYVPIQAYPNPVRDMVTIQHNKAMERSLITLVSPDGRVLQQKLTLSSTYQTQLDLSTLKPGLYLVKYDDGRGSVQTVKIIKN